MGKRKNQTPEQAKLLALLRRPSGTLPGARAKDRKAIEKLIEGGVDLYYWTRERRTFLDVARAAGHLEGVSILLGQPGAVVPAGDARVDFVRKAIREGQAEVAMALVDEHGFPVHEGDGTRLGGSLLNDAAMSAHPRTLIPWLVAHGVEVNPPDNGYPTPLATAVSLAMGTRGQDPIGAVDALLAHGARTDRAGGLSGDGGGVLHVLALRTGDELTLPLWEMLLCAGANPRQVDSRGLTPMDLLRIPETQDRKQHEFIQNTGAGSGAAWVAPPGRGRIEDLVALHEQLNTLPAPGGKQGGPRF